MSVIVGTNSWVTIAQADAYLATKYGAGAWAAFSVADKTALLITAFNIIRFQSGYNVPASSTSQVVKDAQCLLAWWWYLHGEEWDKRAALYASGVRSFTVMSFQEDLATAHIKEMLIDFATGNGNYLPRISRPY
jgi:hypothetical protein